MLRKFIAPLHPSWTFYAAVWGVIAGLIINTVLQSLLFHHPVWLIVSLLLIIISLRFSSRATCILAVLAGLLLGHFRASFQFIGHDLLPSQLDQTVLLTGKLSDDPTTKNGSTVLTLDELNLCPNSNPAPDPDYSSCATIAGRAYITVSSKYEFERSDRVILRGKLGAGFGTYALKMSRPEVINLERSATGDIFARFKHWFADRIRDSIPSPAADLGLGYLMGMKTGLSEDFSEALRTVGMTHVVVASGAHLAILIGAAQRIFGKLSRFAGLLCSLLLIAAFVLIVGFTPSMTRAALVASLSLLTGYVGRNFTPLRLIAFVAMLTLLISPINFLNLGWQLSFASFFGILIFAPRLQRALYGGKTPPWLASMLITSTATSLACAPILIFSFGALSLLSLVANLVILPTLPHVMLLMLLTGITSFLPALAALIALPTQWLLELHIFVVNYLSTKTMFILNFSAEHPLVFLLYIPLILFLLWPYRRKRRPKRLSPRAFHQLILDTSPSFFSRI